MFSFYASVRLLEIRSGQSDTYGRRFLLGRDLVEGVIGARRDVAFARGRSVLGIEAMLCA